MPRKNSHPAKLPKRTGATKPELVIITGLSGSGKASVLKALEDLGFYSVDNMPVELIPKFAELILDNPSIHAAALVVDVREGSQLEKLPAILKSVKLTIPTRVIYLEASDAALLRRFSETRRPHPLAPDRSVDEGIRDERSRLNAIRDLADEIIDTSDMTVHELRQFFMGLSRDRSGARLVITLLSFGYKHGVPVDADLLFDVRCLPNPHFVPTLRHRTGRDRAVAAYLERDEAAREFMDRLEEYLRYVVPFYVAEGKSYLTVGIGCTGGRHRSVRIAERLRPALANLGVAQVRVRHRDLARE